MAANPIFPLYYNDMDRSTRDWTDEEFGCYMRLLMHQWAQGEIPKETQRLARIAPSVTQNWNLLKPKFTETETGMVNERLEEIREERKSFLKKQQSNGKLGGRKPKPNPTDYPNTNPKQSLHNEEEDEVEDESKIENEKFLVPQILQNWYQTFPTYTKSKTDDFPAVLRIISFMMQQHGIPNMNEPDAKEKIQGTFNAISQEITKDQFWINKPIKSIANNIQEFYNKIKNPQHGSHKQPSSRQAANKQSIDYLLDSISNDIQRTGEQDNRA